MTTLLSLILFVIVTSFAGFNIIMLFDKRCVFNWPEKLGLSYLFGIGAISLEMFIMGLFKFEFVTACILAPWVVLFLFNVIVRRLSDKPFFVSFPRKRESILNIDSCFHRNDKGVVGLAMTVFEKILFFLLSFQVIYTFFRALMKPIESYDSVAIWALKAKILYLARTIPADFFHMITTTFHGIHADYPLLVPFSEVWFYTFFGNFNDYLVKIIFPLNLLAFLLVFYSVLRRITGKRKPALLFTFMLASVKQFSDYATIGSADLQMAIYCFLTFIFLFMWVKDKKTPYLAASIISCIFTFWTKNEGSVVLLLTLILLVGSFFMGRRPFFAVFILFTAFTAWTLFKANLRLESDIINIGAIKAISFSDSYKRLIPIAYEYQKHIFGFKKWNLAWIIFLYSVIIGFKRLSKEYLYIIIPIGAILSAYTVIYMITPQEIHWHLSASASRLLLHILPLAVFFAAVNISDIYNAT